jgi:hypothetical protein
MGFNIQQYEQAIAKNGGDNWSNATGYTKEELISKIRTAKDSIEQWTNEKNSAQVRYDEANSRNCPSPCRDRCHPKCDTKTADKEYNLAILNSRTLSINTAQANIPVWQNELDDLIEKEANTTSPNTGGGATTGGGTNTKPNTGGGTSPNTGGGTTTTPKKSNTVLYASIGGAVLILGVVGYFVFRKK